MFLGTLNYRYYINVHFSFYRDECCNNQSGRVFLSQIGECFPIHVEAGDPALSRNCIPFVRSSPVPGLPNTPSKWALHAPLKWVEFIFHGMNEYLHL